MAYGVYLGGVVYYLSCTLYTFYSIIPLYVLYIYFYMSVSERMAGMIMIHRRGSIGHLERLKSLSRHVMSSRTKSRYNQHCHRHVEL